ncbi:MAG: hypothetical protein JWL83_4304 [Actinomycetia bacterium]|nr:hypothetical protein [Actinomycetes bacterium]
MIGARHFDRWAGALVRDGRDHARASRPAGRVLDGVLVVRVGTPPVTLRPVATGAQQQQDAVVPWARPEPYRPPGTGFVVTIVVLGGVVLAVFAGALAWMAWNDRVPHEPRRAAIGYQEFLTLVRADSVLSIYYDNPTGVVTGTFSNGHTERGLSHFELQAPANSLPTADVILLVDHQVVIGSETGDPQPSSGGHEPWWEHAIEWSSTLQAAMLILAVVGVVGLIGIRRRQSPGPR